MEQLKEYRIAFRGLTEGVHTFHYVLDKVFFNHFEATQGTEGKIDARVDVVKSALLIELQMEIGGEVRATCDRCLEELDLSIGGEMKLIVKQGEREEGNDDDFIVLTPEEDYLDLSIPLYEMYMLNFPLRVVHPEGECNPEMEQVLKNLLTDEHNVDEDKIDPRWDELRKLINN